MENFLLNPINIEPLILPALITSNSTEETFILGERLALLLEKGGIVAMKGPLGAGKTCFAKGIARGLGIDEELKSPTYTIVSEYEGIKNGVKVPVYHIDAFRLGGNDDFTAIGGEEIVFGDGISVIEWSERIPAFIPPAAFRVDIEILENDIRQINIYRDAG